MLNAIQLLLTNVLPVCLAAAAPATGMAHPSGTVQVLLSGINQVVLGDKRSMRFSHCGSASSLHYAVMAPPKESA